MDIFVVTRKDKLLFHFGILLNSGHVLHFASKTNNMFAGDQMVKDEGLDQFSNQRKVEICYRILGMEDREIISRAKEYWGKNKKYSLLDNNCITFVLWCLYKDTKCCLLKTFCFYVKYGIMRQRLI